MLTQIVTTLLDSLNLDYRMREILEAEPRLRPILDQAINQETGPKYDRIRTYFRLRSQIVQLVGWHAEHPNLRNSADYQLVIETLINLLPPDHLDLRFPPPPLYRRYNTDI